MKRNANEEERFCDAERWIASRCAFIPSPDRCRGTKAPGLCSSEYNEIRALLLTRVAPEGKRTRGSYLLVSAEIECESWALFGVVQNIFWPRPPLQLVRPDQVSVMSVAEQRGGGGHRLSVIL